MLGLVVTGGASGIGAQIATSRGYRVGVLDANAEAANQVAAKLDQAQALHCDVTNSDQLANALSDFGDIHTFVNCAGILRSYITGQILSVDGALGHSALHGLARE